MRIRCVEIGKLEHFPVFFQRAAKRVSFFASTFNCIQIADLLT